MRKLLIVVDVQNDFIDGALGSESAKKVIPNIVEKIRNWDGDILCTMDTHFEKYEDTYEGKHLPTAHCVYESEGYNMPDDVFKATEHRCTRFINKGTFTDEIVFQKISSLERWYQETYDEIQIIGLVTDICVINTALMLVNKISYRPNTKLIVDSSCCAGTTEENHEAALKVMRSCLIDII